MANHRHKKIVKMAKGYRGRTNCFRIAVQRVEKALQYAYRDRKVSDWLTTVRRVATCLLARLGPARLGHPSSSVPDEISLHI